MVVSLYVLALWLTGDLSTRVYFASTLLHGLDSTAVNMLIYY